MHLHNKRLSDSCLAHHNDPKKYGFMCLRIGVKTNINPLALPVEQDNWIRIFDVPETKLHPDGYVLYKISSTVFQRKFPEAETSLHIWRRYSSIRNLQKDISKLHVKFGLPGEPPQFTKASLLTNRYDEALIENRRKMTINLMQHCAFHRALFSSEQFANFFKEQELSKRNLYFKRRKSLEREEEIVASSQVSKKAAVPLIQSMFVRKAEKRQLRSANDRYPLPVPSSNVLGAPVIDPTSDTSEAVGVLKLSTEDDLSSLSLNELGGMTDKNPRNQDLPFAANIFISNKPPEPPCDDLEKSEIIPSNFSDEDKEKNLISFKAPFCSGQIIGEENRLPSTSRDSLQSINKNIPILQSYECDERSITKRKTSGYLLKVEQLINRFSSRDGKLHHSGPLTISSRKSTSIYDSYLKNYKVVGMAGKCILAVDILTQETVAVKVLEKSEKEFKIVPPCHIPFMVPVLQYHEGEFAIYVVLKYFRDAKLWEKLKKYLKQPPKWATKYSKLTYSGKRFIYEGLNNVTDEMVMGTLDETQTSKGENDEISDITSFSMNLELAISECKSTIENFSQPFPMNKSRFLSSLSSLTPPAKTGNMLTRFNADVKSKSLDYLDCSEENDFSNFNKININQSEKSVNSLECDNRSIGSDTLSGISDDFSCSSFTQIGSEHQPRKSLNEIQSTSNRKNLENYDVNKLIQNSKKLLEDVATTLERSKKQFLSKVTVRTSNEKPKPNLRIEISGQNSQGDTLPGVIESSCGPFVANKDVTSDNHHLPFSILLDTYSSNSNLGERSILPEGLVRVWVSQVVSAFEALHNQGFIWGDFNLSNLLLDEGGSILVTHFYEWAAGRKNRHFCNSWQLSRGHDNLAASLGYVAPELFQPLTTPSFACDWWSVGALLFHLVTGQDLASAHPCGINSHTYINVPSNVSQEASSLIRNLLCAHPSERLGGSLAGAQEIKCHPFFFGIQWSP